MPLPRRAADVKPTAVGLASPRACCPPSPHSQAQQHRVETAPWDSSTVSSASNAPSRNARDTACNGRRPRRLHHLRGASHHQTCIPSQASSLDLITSLHHEKHRRLHARSPRPRRSRAAGDGWTSRVTSSGAEAPDQGTPIIAVSHGVRVCGRPSSARARAARRACSAPPLALARTDRYPLC